MKKYYHGAGRRGPYFEGWYLKYQARDGTALALIPAVHIDGCGRRSASLQILTDGGSWWLEYPEREFQASEERFQVRVGQNIFDDSGAWLHIQRKGISLHGILQSGPFAPLRSDIMGPFRFVPGMECAHGVLSMGHPVEGTLTLNGGTVNFSGGTGYVETDWGRSFPDAYLWAQCAWGGGGLMLAVAAVPLAAGSFTGCICAVRHEGREYRLATYRGARVERWDAGGAVIRQGRYRLSVELLEGCGHPLRAPAEGAMERTIHERLRTELRCRLWMGDTLLLDHRDPWASFEYAET